MTEKSLKKIEHEWQGVVVSDKMAKTVVVKVDRVSVHPKYKKRFTVSRKYKVHDENNTAKVGDVVFFIACRPLSKDKKYRLLAVKK